MPGDCGGTKSILCIYRCFRAFRRCRTTCRPSLAAFSFAVAVAVLSVQALYQNAVFVFAACCGGFMLCAVERRWRDTLSISAVGVAAAISLLPYIPLIARAHWYVIYKVG